MFAVDYHCIQTRLKANYKQGEKLFIGIILLALFDDELGRLDVARVIITNYYSHV